MPYVLWQVLAAKSRKYHVKSKVIASKCCKYTGNRNPKKHLQTDPKERNKLTRWFFFTPTTKPLFTSTKTPSKQVSIIIALPSHRNMKKQPQTHQQTTINFSNILFQYYFIILSLLPNDPMTTKSNIEIRILMDNNG